MKNSKIFKSIPLFILCLFQIGYTIAQTGISRATAFEVGALYPGAIFTHTQDNAPGMGSIDGPFPNGVFYKFTLTTTTVVSISTCTSLTDTYLKLLDNAGNLITFKDDKHLINNLLTHFLFI